MTQGELFDTCILIDHLNGIKEAADEIDRAIEPAISQITWIEVMVGTTSRTEAATRAFLQQFSILALDANVSEEVIVIRQGLLSGLPKRPKLPDAIIVATARRHRRLLVTRNTKDFPNGTQGVRIPAYAAGS